MWVIWLSIRLVIWKRLKIMLELSYPQPSRHIRSSSSHNLLSLVRKTLPQLLPLKREVCHETEATPSYSQSLTSLIRCQESWLSLVYFASKQEFISRADTMQCKAGFYVGVRRRSPFFVLIWAIITKCKMIKTRKQWEW